MSEDAHSSDNTMTSEEKVQRTLTECQLILNNLFEKTGIKARYQRRLKELGHEMDLRIVGSLRDSSEDDGIEPEAKILIEAFREAIHGAILTNMDAHDIAEHALARGHNISATVVVNIGPATSDHPPAAEPDSRVVGNAVIWKTGDKESFKALFGSDLDAG